MRLKILCCEVFFRELCSLVASSPHICDVEFLPKGLHDLGCEKMSERLQQFVDGVDAELYYAIVMVYGLCNNGTVGIRSTGCPIVIPKAHDCMTVFLGSRDRYRNCFDANPGTFYRTSGWIEREDASGAGDTTIPQQLGMTMSFPQLVEQYGEENAKYIMETMGDGVQNYDRIAYIRMGLDGEDRFVEEARQEAKRREWRFEELAGDMCLLRKLVSGDWDDDFVVLQPGEALQPSYDEQVMKSAARPNDV